MAEESNKELEDWCDEFAKEFDKFCEEEDRRREEYNLVLGIIFDDRNYDADNFSRVSFEMKKDEIKDYVFVDKLIQCEKGYEDEYINRTYKFIRMEGERCAIFYRDY